ncbi:SCO family protein [Filibacter tadaridae]|uniref:Thioredoxin domain-containing protein n=2 Tax=Filibacter tadaridae TaxID=2483811 RepID=A0A3P5XDF3_9BACL|nr:SCO family protein [Filibacter tadaridae]VDC28880.1 hypothetical protein FILTAD_01884 [Filibacter tadaridae]
MVKKILLPYTLLIVLLLSACTPGGFKADHKYKVEPFEFTNQQNKQVSLDDLKGTVWISQFIFTNCTAACPPMMANMAKLQDLLVKEGIEDYKIVSFSIEPEADTPEVLQEYLSAYDVADESKWEMLTGYSQKKIIDIAAKTFKTAVIDDPANNTVLHGTSFSLVNQKGEFVKSYSGLSDVPYEEIAKDMKALIKQGK